RMRLNIIISKASWVKSALFTVFFIAMYVLINNTAVGVAGLLQITGGASILDFEFGFTADQALDMLTALGKQGRSFYLTRIIPIDFIFPLSYMLCYAGWIALLVKHISPKGHLKLLLLVPILAMLFDWGENMGIIFMLVKYPLLPKWVVISASTAGILKMICIVASVAAIVALFIVLFFKRKKKT
ncbi:hypothetical protein LJC60_07315, partial [Ruminococcaceae bacterium OttesenSCG-928-D13]|nr:hypothetical protein [Ruminococcaceae bacterium OttesenSCG-928-D13]